MSVYEIPLFGYDINCVVTRLDVGVHVLVTGGCLTHIGAVSTAEPDGTVQTQLFPGHKDQYISEPWAKAISEKTGQRTCVVCGIHYDSASQEQIRRIVQAAEKLLESVLQEL